MVEFGAPDKVRPALILTRTSVLPYLNAVTVAPITRTIRGIETEVPLGVAEGLKEPSVALLDAVQTVSQARVGRRLGAVTVSRRSEIRDALLIAFDLEESS
jgi:mRNA interferase MazF